MKPETLTAYLAPEGLVEQVVSSAGKKSKVYDRLVVAKGSPRRVVWAQNIWHEPQRLTFSSISDAANKLRAIQRNWSLYPFTEHRRAALISEQLPHVSASPLSFPAKLPRASLGSWTLLDRNTLLAAASCSSPFPNGEARFKEDKHGPPNRAYLKLWEALTLIEKTPEKNSTCLEIGASPGGWTWVLASLGVQVLAVDRALLAPEVSRQKNVRFKKGDAFSVLPGSSETFEWIFSDVACYPEKLYDWVLAWIESGKCKNVIATLKFQGNTHYGVIDRFSAIPGGRLMHLFHNKHELTFVRLEKLV